MLVRSAIDADSDAIAEVYLRAWAIAMPFVTNAHTDAQVREWIRGRLVPGGRVLVAEEGSSIRAMLAHSEDEKGFWIDQLYVDPDFSRRGIGTALLEQAIALAAGRAIRLYSFQANSTARAFYERHGFRAIDYGDGSGNEERCPDVLYERPPGAPRPAAPRSE
jgi:GNAT superfamily N-acetyltransferase